MALGLAAVAEAHAVSAATAPAGFVRATIAAGNGARTSTSLIGSPLLNAPVYAGRVGLVTHALSATRIASERVSGSRLGAINLSRPHAIFVTSGAFAGFSFRVVAAEGGAVSVESEGFDLTQILEAGDTFEIRPLHTVRTLFGSAPGEVPFAGASDASRADQLLIRRDGAWRAYWFTGSTWRRSGSAGDAGDDVILPQDGIVVYRRAASATQVRFFGDAPATDAVIAAPAGAISTVANPFPVAVGLAELGLETLSGWRCAENVEAADQVQVSSGNTWLTFWFDGARWRNSTGLPEATIDAGAAVLVVRKPSAAANPFALIGRPYDL